jgi:Family of unknown function (DUF5908)
MAIEIREVVIRATVSKTTSGNSSDFVTKQELLRINEKLQDKVLKQVKEFLNEERSSR